MYIPIIWDIVNSKENISVKILKMILIKVKKQNTLRVSKEIMDHQVLGII